MNLDRRKVKTKETRRKEFLKLWWVKGTICLYLVMSLFFGRMKLEGGEKEVPREKDLKNEGPSW